MEVAESSLLSKDAFSLLSKYFSLLSKHAGLAALAVRLDEITFSPAAGHCPLPPPAFLASKESSK
jgi:hypothetical protein